MEVGAMTWMMVDRTYFCVVFSSTSCQDELVSKFLIICCFFLIQFLKGMAVGHNVYRNTGMNKKMMHGNMLTYMTLLMNRAELQNNTGMMQRSVSGKML